MLKKIIYIVLSFILTILVLGGIFIAGALSQNIEVNKLIAGTKYEVLKEDEYNQILLKIYLKTLNTKKEYDIEQAFECKYIISYGDKGQSICSDGGKYALYQKSAIDNLADSKTKVVQFFNQDASEYDKLLLEKKIIKVPSYLQKLIRKI